MALYEGTFIHLLHRATQTAHELFESATLDHTVTPRQYIVLAAIAECEGTSQRRIAEVTGVDRSTLTDLIRRLINLGLLMRQRSRRDMRSDFLTLTPLGHEILKGADASAKSVDQELLRTLPPGAGQDLVVALENIARARTTTPPAQPGRASRQPLRRQT